MDKTVKVRSMKRLNLRSIWTEEAGQFTPWLAENIQLLGDALGLSLEVMEQEKRVGLFRADIVANDALTGDVVLIENQLERTDHSHLGQLLTYAAGLRAGVVVWITEKFCDEHRAAVDWFNEAMAGDVRFFGLEIELWSIENSAPAAKFTVVCRPNRWKKRLTLRLEGSAEERLQAAYEQLIKFGGRVSGRTLAREAHVNRRAATKWLLEVQGQQEEPEPIVSMGPGGEIESIYSELV